MKVCAKMLVVTFFLAVLVPERVLSAKKAEQLHRVYNLHRSNDSVSKAFTRIVGGTSALPSEFPWQAQLVDSNKVPFCGGTLIGTHTILTAAHCLLKEDGTKRNYTVRLGARMHQDDPVFHEYGQDIKVFYTEIHKWYNKDRLSYDAALLLLDEPVKENAFIKKVHLPVAGNALIATKCVVTGFGATDKSGTTFPETLQKLDLPTVPHDINECMLSDKSLLCAGKGKEMQGYCIGDAGGPFVCKHDKLDGGEYYLHGIIRRDNTPCADGGRHIIFVNVMHLLPWINAYAS